MGKLGPREFTVNFCLVFLLFIYSLPYYSVSVFLSIVLPVWRNKDVHNGQRSLCVKHKLNVKK